MVLLQKRRLLTQLRRRSEILDRFLDSLWHIREVLEKADGQSATDLISLLLLWEMVYREVQR